MLNVHQGYIHCLKIFHETLFLQLTQYRIQIHKGEHYHRHDVTASFPHLSRGGPPVISGEAPWPTTRCALFAVISPRANRRSPQKPASRSTEVNAPSLPPCFDRRTTNWPRGTKLSSTSCYTCIGADIGDPILTSGVTRLLLASDIFEVVFLEVVLFSFYYLYLFW